jgi:hypothetical protein
MILYYIDESGTGLKDRNTPYLVLAAVAAHTDHWRIVDGRVTAVKRSLIPYAKPEDFELKGRDIQRGEKLFSPLDWPRRAKALSEVAELIAELPLQLFAVLADKRALAAVVDSEEALYRMVFWRLLDLIQADLARAQQLGMVMVDSRSDLHSSVQDRRLVDAYRDWLNDHGGQSHLVDLPWFGFSAFYAGLQLADVAAYLLDCVANDPEQGPRRAPLREACGKLQPKLNMVRIP